MFQILSHPAAAPIVVRSEPLFQWWTNFMSDAKTAILATAGVVILVVAIILLFKHWGKIGQMIVGFLTLTIGAAMIFGGIVMSTQEKVSDQIGSAPVSNYQQIL